MSLTSYAGLQAVVADYLDRTDLTTQIVDFIAAAEARFNRVIRSPEMITNDTAFTIDSQYENTPTNFLEARRFLLATSPIVRLSYITPEQMSEWRVGRRASGRPRHFTVVGTTFEFFPTPDASYTGELAYYVAMDGLATTDPNWLLTKHPDIYLFGTLVEAEPFVMNDERFPLWEARLDKALAQLKISEDNKKVGTTPTARMRSFG